MKEFEMIEPRTREEACQWLDRFKGKARPYAGGTDLLVELKTGRVKLDALVNLKRIRGLDKIRFSGKNGLAIGALTTWTQLLESEAVSAHTLYCARLRNPWGPRRSGMWPHWPETSATLHRRPTAPFPCCSMRPFVWSRG